MDCKVLVGVIFLCTKVIIVKMKKIFTILFAVFVFLLVIEFGQSHEGHRHPNPLHRPLPIRRPHYGLKPTHRPKPYTKPAIKPHAPIPFPGKGKDTPHHVANKTQ